MTTPTWLGPDDDDLTQDEPPALYEHGDAWLSVLLIVLMVLGFVVAAAVG